MQCGIHMHLSASSTVLLFLNYTLHAHWKFQLEHTSEIGNAYVLVTSAPARKAVHSKAA